MHPITHSVPSISNINFMNHEASDKFQFYLFLFFVTSSRSLSLKMTVPSSNLLFFLPGSPCEPGCSSSSWSELATSYFSTYSWNLGLISIYPFNLVNCCTYSSLSPKTKTSLLNLSLTTLGLCLASLSSRQASRNSGALRWMYFTRAANQYLERFSEKAKLHVQLRDTGTLKMLKAGALRAVGCVRGSEGFGGWERERADLRVSKEEVVGWSRRYFLRNSFKRKN